MNRKEPKKNLIKPATIQKVAEFLELSPRTVEKYPKKKLELMKLGLTAKKYNEDILMGKMDKNKEDIS